MGPIAPPTLPRLAGLGGKCPMAFLAACRKALPSPTPLGFCGCFITRRTVSELNLVPVQFLIQIQLCELLAIVDFFFSHFMFSSFLVGCRFLVFCDLVELLHWIRSHDQRWPSCLTPLKVRCLYSAIELRVKIQNLMIHDSRKAQYPRKLLGRLVRKCLRRHRLSYLSSRRF